MDKVKLVTETLLELRVSAKLIKSEEDLKATMRKYDMLFVGEKFNTIYARELQHSLEKVFKKRISMPDLLAMIPDVCSLIGMEVDAMTFVDDPERKIADYQITLF
ncbi:hypothetical protein WJ0W_005779 [Paenibacillus melissococcoides]|uniref:Uncharacterized protein n=1 Tax=Paenibacillus melissococcoides TaxID=2912268 RepID=A0ABM9GAB0_9BACL|nr:MULTISPECIES: hypothetical protein [Paenibacillus]MEB9896786.1 hypothetical protein [Bacillus cereus]CAH8248595.1 hypothetical protein WJ0W_005779 [Paenibacillus melissococcoides]CAH8714300.1 hypothetical protein WDD9_003833 [Paenibacillus melissococcoides]CAH8719933.1 hypothetical protein HTL2_005774 [Paenibacillus melissococcoides]GIO79575.1 hypothetical protein J6TS7_31850 [Paenibacillus dendritiformis]